MTLPAFADVDALHNRIPDGISDSDRPRAQAALDDASTLIRAEAGKTWVNDAGALEDVPDIIVTICLAAARRHIVNPDGVESETETFDRFSQARSYGNSSSLDVYLTKKETAHVRRAAGRTGLWSQGTTRADSSGIATDLEVLDLNGVGYLGTVPAGDPMPYFGAEDL